MGALEIRVSVVTSIIKHSGLFTVETILLDDSPALCIFLFFKTKNKNGLSLTHLEKQLYSWKLFP